MLSIYGCSVLKIDDIIWEDHSGVMSSLSQVQAGPSVSGFFFSLNKWLPYPFFFFFSLSPFTLSASQLSPSLVAMVKGSSQLVCTFRSCASHKADIRLPRSALTLTSLNCFSFSEGHSLLFAIIAVTSAQLFTRPIV